VTRGTRVLAATAVLITALGTLDLVQHYELGVAAAVGLSLLRVAPYLLLRRPLLAWAGSLAATVLTALPADPVSAAEPWPWAVTSLLAAAPVLIVVGSRHRPPVLVAVLASALAAAAGLLAAADRGQWYELVRTGALAGAALAAGWLLRGWLEARREVFRQVRRSEGLQERARLARELHDVIAHGLTEVTVRADSAPHRVPDVPPAAAAEFTAIADAARGALAELRQVLGVLRDPGADPDTLPLPGLADLPALAGDPGLAVPAGVPPAVQLAAYRIVQEALRNARRHAPGAPCAVDLAVDGPALRVTVTNPAGGPPGPPGSGYGLAGMRERAALHGGHLRAGPRPDGGWRVEAVLPWG
jgi:signal transduction histidine kinase